MKRSIGCAVDDESQPDPKKSRQENGKGRTKTWLKHAILHCDLESIEEHRGNTSLYHQPMSCSGHADSSGYLRCAKEVTPLNLAVGRYITHDQSSKRATNGPMSTEGRRFEIVKVLAGVQDSRLGYIFDTAVYIMQCSARCLYGRRGIRAALCLKLILPKLDEENGVHQRRLVPEDYARKYVSDYLKIFNAAFRRADTLCLTTLIQWILGPQHTGFPDGKSKVAFILVIVLNDAISLCGALHDPDTICPLIVKQVEFLTGKSNFERYLNIPENGNKPLHRAAKNFSNCEGVLKMLLHYKANPRYENSRGQTSLEILRAMQSNENKLFRHTKLYEQQSIESWRRFEKACALEQIERSIALVEKRERECNEREVAVAMALHPRLGRGSPLYGLEEGLVSMIGLLGAQMHYAYSG